MRLLSIAIGIGVVAGAAAQAPLSTAFTYQGKLDQSGAPATGTYDLRFQLFDAAAGGAPIATDCVDGVVPVNGLFTVELDFGLSPFDGNARWLEVGVRTDATPANCTGGPAYTVLTGRQALTAVPYAMFALDGPGAPGFWAGSGTAISNTNSGFVGIKRSTPVTGAEFFGVQAPVNAGYGGMYIRTDGAAGLPFYGYKAGPTGEVGWTYLDGATGDWRLNLDGDRLTVTDTGLVGIGTTSPASAQLHVVPASGNWGVRVENDGNNSAIYATSSGGTAPTVYAVQSSTAAGAVGLHGLISSATPGAGTAGVRGTVSSSTSNNTYGVWGRHSGPGRGVFGESLSTTGGQGVYGNGWWGVYGVANTSAGYGGVFAGSGFLGSGQALLVWGESHLSTTGIGTTSPQAKLHVNDSSDTSPGGGGIVVIGDTATANISIDANEIMARNNGQTSTLYLNHEGGDVRIGQNAAVAPTLYVPVVAITGADVAEKFPTSESSDAVKPGTVMEIDPDHAGKLRVARGAYNRRVAGVVSGAGDIPVGAILGNLPGHEDAPAIALSGRVWVQCDATSGAIEAGDLLTTSDTAGHAMKAADLPRAQGATIGKAMSGLAAGKKGLVLVLVNLQ
ncbi:MAG: hypothetical protein U1D55_01800 [Phycisphaerae bacterium]